MNKKIRWIILSYVILNLVSNIKAFGQECEIVLTGKVIDHHHESSLSFASIYIQELKRETICDEFGNFGFPDLCPGDYHFIISHIGCESKMEFRHIVNSQTIIFFMEHHDELLEEVEIKGKESSNKTGLSKSTISKNMLLELSGSSLSDLVSNIPGVSIIKSGPTLSKPIIDGLYGNRITILNHGVPQEGQQWGNDHAPEIDPNTTDKISIYKGANAIKYGLQTIGGLIVVEPTHLIFDPHWHGQLKTNLQSNGNVYSIDGSIKNSFKIGNIKLTAGWMQGGDRRTPNYFLTNTGNKESSFSFQINNNDQVNNIRSFYYSFYHNVSGILRGSHIGNLSDLTEAFIRDQPFFTEDKFSYLIDVPRQDVDHHLWKYSQKYALNEKSMLQFESAIQTNIRKEFDIRRGNRDSKPSLSLTLWSHYSDLSYLYSSPHSKKSFNIGLQYKYGNNTNNPGTGVSPLIPDYINHQLAIYIIDKFELLKLPFEFGFRSEYRNYNIYGVKENGIIVNPVKKYFNWAGNIGTTISINDEFNTNFDISFTNRPPEINELYSKGLHQGVSGIEEGNEGLSSEKSFKITNSWNGHILKKLHINASFFYNHFSNFIYLDPSDEIRLTIRGAFPVFQYVGADVRMLGSSFQSNLALTSHINWKNKINYVYATNLESKNGLIRIPPMSASSNLSIQFSKTKWYQEIETAFEIVHTSEQTNIDPMEDFLLPPKDYLLTNAMVKIKWKKKNNRDVDVIVKANNLFDVRYRDYLNRFRYFADDLGRNFMVTVSTSF